jgi:hypothetical protein
MRSFRTIGTALTVAVVMAATMTVSSERLLAAGGGNSQAVLCRNLERAIASLTAIYGAEAELVVALQAEYNANCVAPAAE